MTNSSTLPDDILAEIDSAGGNLSQVARALGINYYALKARSGGFPQPVTLPKPVDEPGDFRDLAKPSLRNFAIAAKRVGFDWPRKYQTNILRGRQLYDSGTHEMCQGRRDGWVLLYLIPRLVPVRPRTFFSSMEVL